MPRKPSAPKRTLARAVKSPAKPKRKPAGIDYQQLDDLQFVPLKAALFKGFGDFELPKRPKRKSVKVKRGKISRKNLLRLIAAIEQRPTAQPDNQIALVSPEGNVILVAPVEAEVSRYIELGYVPERI